MKILVKSLVVWFLLLAVPFQGFASATMLICAPIQLPVSAPSPHAHHEAMEGQHHDGAQHLQAAATDDHHDGGKCDTCAKCCVGAAMAPSNPVCLAADTQHRTAIPFDMAFMPTVELALPERPPQASLT